MLFKEDHRVLKPGSLLILTTSASWSDGILRFMANIRLVSKKEIHKHVCLFASSAWLIF